MIASAPADVLFLDRIDTTLRCVNMTELQDTTLESVLEVMSKAEAVERVKAQARAIADAPDLAELPDEVLAKLAEAAAIDTWKAKLKGEADRVATDCQGRTRVGVGASRKTGSRRARGCTRRAIAQGLEVCCQTQGIEVLELIPATAVMWIAHLREEDRASATVRLDVAAASAFWTQLERWHTSLRNPHGAREPNKEKQAKRELVTPSEAEVETLERSRSRRMAESRRDGRSRAASRGASEPAYQRHDLESDDQKQEADRRNARGGTEGD